MKSFLNRQVRLAFGFALLTLVLTGALCYRWMGIADESALWIRHTRNVLESIQDLNLVMERIDSASRAFALTGQESDLDSYGASVSRAEQDLTSIRNLTADNPTQQFHIASIESLAAERIQHADTVISLRRSLGITAAAAAVRSGGDDPTRNEFQAMAGTMRDEELRLLALRRAKTDRDRSWTRVILILGTLLGMLVAVLAARSALAESARRLAAEGALQDSEEKYRLLLDGVQDYAILMLDPQGLVAGWSTSAERMQGYTAEEIVGRNFSCFFLAEDIDRRRPEEMLRIAAATGRHEEVCMCVRKDGSEFLAGISLKPLRNAAGDLRGFSEICRDLTEHKKSEERYRGLLEAAPDAMVVVNEAGEIVLLNAQAEKQLGYRRDELLGQNVKNIIPEGFAERLIADALRTTAEALAQQIGTGIELYGRRKDGTEFPIEIMLSPLQSAEGVLVTAAIRDISERKQLASQLRQSQKMEAIGLLTGGIAHDFNNLLAIVIGNLGLLERLIDGNDAALKRLKPAQKAAARGADLTRRLLGLASKEDLNPVSIRLDEAIQETIELAGRALGPEIKIFTNFDLAVPAVFVDVAGLESALLNLAVNARDAMPQGGTLTIGTQLSHLDESFPPVQTGELNSGAYARISVSDTGHGMSRETLDRALEPFFTTKTRTKGTGLGLAMVYGFARQSGGTVRLYSEQGHGTTVTLYLPLAGESAPAAPELPAAHVSSHAGGTVLVVDDEPELLEIAHEYLVAMGYSVLRADNAPSALKTIAEDSEIDLMITDIIMPGGMNGVELAEKARLLSPRLKVIYSSGFPADALVERKRTRAGDPMLRKPYQRTEFAAMVRRTLAGTTT
jgi:PAS domain S-box-containing protein